MELMGFFVIRAICGAGIAWAGSPREPSWSRAQGDSGAWVTPGNAKSPLGAGDTALELLGDSCAVPLAAAAGKARPELELLLLQPSPAASPGPGHSHESGAAPAFPGQEGTWEGTLGAESCGFVL